jgi:hypothetical protein
MLMRIPLFPITPESIAQEEEFAFGGFELDPDVDELADQVERLDFALEIQSQVALMNHRSFF